MNQIKLLQKLRCPNCRTGKLSFAAENQLVCKNCSYSFTVKNGIPILLTNESLRNRIVSNAMDKLKHVYDWSIIADHTIKVYQNVLDEWKSHSWKTKEDLLKYKSKKK